MANRELIRPIVRGAYDLQKLRIQMGNRLVANFKHKLGQLPSQSEEEALEGKELEVLQILRLSYKRITDGVVEKRRKLLPKEFEPDGLISNYTELSLVDQYVELLLSEQRTFKLVKEGLEEFPIYTNYLKGVKGIGETLAGVIISEIDIHAAKYPSSIWKYAGLDVAGDGQGRSRKKEHLVKRAYTSKEGEELERDSITFNPFLKTKLLGVMAPSFIKSKNEKYAPMYYDYKHRLENHPNHVEKTKLHRHRMALRYIAKHFLIDLYNEWRPLEGLEVAPSYQEAKLGHIHGQKVA